MSVDARPDGAVVYVIDDDAAVRDSLEWLIEADDLAVETFDSAAAFLQRPEPDCPACVVVDVRMPGMSGLDLQRQLAAQRRELPVIVITGHGDVDMAVRAMKAGAVDFIEKPFDDRELLDRIRTALERSREAMDERAKTEIFRVRLNSLSPREHEVLDLVVAGKPNKVIAHQLGISEKTVEAHRARVMTKMQAKSFADLLTQSILSGVYPGNP